MNQSIDIDIERENFAIQASLLRMQFEQMLSITKDLEKQLTDPQVSTTDFYRSSVEIEMPPKKRVKYNN